MLVSSPLLEPLRQVFRSISRDEKIIGGLKADPESPFRAMIEDLPDPLLVLDPEGIILYANTAWREIRSLSIEESLGKRITDLAELGERQAIADSRREVLRSLTPENRSVTMQFSLSDDKHVQVVYTGWFDGAGELLAISALARDRTEAHEYEEELTEANQALADSNRDLQDFAHIASHDLQEPLRKISAFSERLTDKYATELDGRGLDYLSRISSASDRMQQLIQSLLDFGRVNSTAADFEKIDLNGIVEAVLGDLEVAIEESNATVTFDDLPVVHCDPVQMRQLFQNLLGNALKFRREDEDPQIAVNYQVVETGIILTVTDNGIGFEQEYADKIFGPFQRLNTRTAYAGSGIGLSVVRRIVERHGGTIAATSAAGEGAVFTIELGWPSG